ncbi:hypothetical protein [Flavobacterium sp. N2038]|uniref:hypothetical protein n=1 Tax=Flavobacterium sp. N2038 TaxID=2986829 RepID=UPI0022259ED5|nr:hypothetical protein [Flavobacterium sp. N2038]
MQNINKYSVFKRLLLVLVFLCTINIAQAQAPKYIMYFDGPIYYSECNCQYTDFHVDYNGARLLSIGEQKVDTGTFLIYDKRPTYYYLTLYRPDSYSCSGPCRDELDYGIAGNITTNCVSQNPGMYMITNQVLVDPGIDNNFCDKIALKATGCTGPQRFFWEYKIDGGDFEKTNISTAFDETFQFVKTDYLPSTYTGNIDFRALIDSDPTVTGENVYSNIVYYNVIPCSPDVVGKPATSKTSCIYTQDGTVTIEFSRKLVTNETFSFNFRTLDNATLPTPSYTIDASQKIYTFTGVPQGSYYVIYQTFINGQYSSTNKLPNPSFTISPPDPLFFEVIDTQPLCRDTNGMITIKAKGGASPYYYQINSGPEIKFTLPAEVPKPPGNYSIYVRDSKTCIDTTAND